MQKPHSFSARRLPRRLGQLLTVSALVSALTATGASAAASHLYWTVAQLPGADNCSMGIGSSIGRATLDGSQIDGRFVNLGGWGCASPFLLGSDVQPLAVEGQHLYWVDEAHHTIARANLNGTGVDDQFIHFPVSDPYDPDPVTGIAVDAAHIYWINEDASGTVRTPVTAIGRAKLAGSDVQQQFIAAPEAWGGIASDGRHLYWGSVVGDGSGRTSIVRANANGTNARQLIRFDRGLDGAGVTGLVVHAGRLYWVNYDTSAIGSAALDGSHVKTLVKADDVTGLAVSDTHLYWIDDIDTAIGRAQVNGSHADPAFISNALNHVGIAVGRAR